MYPLGPLGCVCNSVPLEILWVLASWLGFPAVLLSWLLREMLGYREDIFYRMDEGKQNLVSWHYLKSLCAHSFV